jgi:DnaJ family protein C protein 8
MHPPSHKGLHSARRLAPRSRPARPPAARSWEASRDERVGSWRDFMNKSKKQKKMPGEFKPPKQKTRDEEKLYVQRPVGEQFRPNAHKPPAPAQR